MKRFLLGVATSFLTVSLAFAQPAPRNTPSSASGENNPPVATTTDNADQPAKGANSFTKGQARNRIVKMGFSKVTSLSKDKDGVWRGSAQKDGQSVDVWLDYKGNVGQTH
jgi:hypothetical protein